MNHRLLQHLLCFPIIICNTPLNQSKNTAHDQQQTKNHKDLARNIVQVMPVKSPTKPLQNQQSPYYCQNSYQATQHTVWKLPPAPPVHKIAPCPDLRDTYYRPGKPHHVTMYFYGFKRRRVRRWRWCSPKSASTILQQCDSKIEMVTWSMVWEILITWIVSGYHLKLCTNRNNVGIQACCGSRSCRNPAGSGRCHCMCTCVWINRINAWLRMSRRIKVLLDTWCSISRPKTHISIGHGITVPHSNVRPKGNIYIVHDGLCRWVVWDLHRCSVCVVTQ